MQARSTFASSYLRYGWAQDMTMTMGGRQIVIPGVASILRSLVGAQASAPLGQEIMLRPTQPSLKGQGLGARGRPPKSSKGGGREAAADMLVAALARTALPAEPAQPPTIAADPNQIRIEADPRLNAIIVRDLADRLPRYEQLIAALDVEPQSLEIEATIIDINTDRMRELGVNWRWSNAGNEVLFGNGTASDLLLRAGQTVTPLGRGGIISAVLGRRASSSPASPHCRPKGRHASSRARRWSRCRMSKPCSTTARPFSSASQARTRSISSTSAPATSLRVTPHVFRDKDATRIKLMVQVERRQPHGPAGRQDPGRRAFDDQYAGPLIAEGESLLIGGMTRDSSSSNVDKVPGLGDLPVVGNLFKTRTNSSRPRRTHVPDHAAARRDPASCGRHWAPPRPRACRAQPVVTRCADARAAADARRAGTPPRHAAAGDGTGPLRVAARRTQTPPSGAASPVAYSPPARASVVLDLDAPLPAAAAPPRGASGTPPGAGHTPAAAPTQVGLTSNTQR